RVVPAQIELVPFAPEIYRNVMQVVGAALEGHPEILAERTEIALAIARHDDPVGAERILGQAPPDQLRRHQRRHLHADIVDGPGEIERAELAQDVAQPLLREMAGQEQGVAGHGSRAAPCCRPAVPDRALALRAIIAPMLARNSARGKLLTKLLPSCPCKRRPRVTHWISAVARMAVRFG